MTTVTIRLLGNLDGNQLSQAVKTFINQCNGALPANVVVDFSGLTFIRPAGVTFLSNFIHWLSRNNRTALLVGVEQYSAPIRYLDDSLFFEQHIGRKLRCGARPRSTTLPLQKISSDASFAWLRQQLIPWLAGKLGVRPNALYPFQTCVAEIFHNIKDHSQEINGSVFVQHFPNANEVCISVADFGRGIPDSVRTVRPTMSDTDAIIEAVKEGFTAGTTPGNRGAGLDYLLTTVVKSGNGSVTIHSLEGHVLFTKLRNNIKHQALIVQGWCPGTTIDIVFKTDSIVDDAEEAEELIW